VAKGALTNRLLASHSLIAAFTIPRGVVGMRARKLTHIIMAIGFVTVTAV
jgi:hypothetical protein